MSLAIDRSSRSGCLVRTEPPVSRVCQEVITRVVFSFLEGKELGRVSLTKKEWRKWVAGTRILAAAFQRARISGSLNFQLRIDCQKIALIRSPSMIRQGEDRVFSMASCRSWF